MRRATTVRGRPPADARLDELGDCRERIRLGPALRLGRADDDRDLAARRLGEAPGELVGAPANDLLEALGQLAADCDRTPRQSLGERAETRGQPARGLEGDQRVGPSGELGPESSPRAFGAREVPDELVPLPDEPARDERRLHGGRAGQHRHRHTLLPRGIDQTDARIVHPRQACVARQRDPLTGLEPGQYLSGPLRLVVLVVAEELRLDPVPLEQDLRPPRVLAEDEVRLRQLTEDAQRHVFEVPDRRRADRQQ